MSNAGRAAERYINAMNTGELADLSDFIADNCRQTIAGFPENSGIDGIRDYIAMLRTAYPDLQQTIDDLIATDERVAFRGTLRGTQHGPLRTIPASGNAIDLPYLAYCEVVDGKLSQIQVSLDRLDYLQQLGVIAEPM